MEALLLEPPRERARRLWGCHSDGILDKQGSEVMFTPQTLNFLHVTSDRRYMVARGGEKET